MNFESIKRINRKVLVVLLLALVVRLLFFFAVYLNHTEQEILSTPDFAQPFYLALAQNIADNKVFALSATEPFDYNTFHVPIYPFFVALGYVTTDSLLFFSLLQICLSVFLVFLVFLLGMKVFGEKVGLLASTLVALEPFAAFSSFVIFSETLFLLLLFGSLWFLWKFYHTGKLPHIAYSGVLLGLATLTRSVAQFLSLLFLVAIIFFARKYFKRFSLLKPLAVFLVSFVLVLSPWILRNYYHYDSASLSYLSGYTFYLYNVGDFETGQNSSFGNYNDRDQTRNELRSEFLEKINDPEIAEVDENVPLLIKYSSTFFRAALRKISEHPLAYLKYQTIFTGSSLLNEGYREILSAYGFSGFEQSHFLTKLLKPKTLQPPETEGSDQSLNTLLNIAEFVWIMVFAISIAAVVKSLYRKDFQNFGILLFFGLIAVYFNFAAGSLSSGRYHFPSVPFILLIFSFSFYYLFKNSQDGSNSRLEN